MNAPHEIKNIAIIIELVHAVKPKAKEQTVNNANNPIGRRSSAAKRSATQPQKK